MAVGAAPRDDLKGKLLLSIVDKLVFGLLIVLAGFVLNLVLENHRADQALKTEIARVRVQKVAETWQALDSHQRAVNSLGQSDVDRIYGRFAFLGQPKRFLILKLKQQGYERLKDRGAQYAGLRARERRLSARVNANRFWIGKTLYPEYAIYLAKQRGLLRIYASYHDTLLKVVRPVETRVLAGDFTPGYRRSAWDEAGELFDWVTQEVKRRTQELNRSRTDVLTAMERLS